LWRDFIEIKVWHLDVGSSYPRTKEKALRVRLFADIKMVRELGLERCETVRSLSVTPKIK